MMLQLQKLSFTLHYRPGREVILADTLLHGHIIEYDTSQSTFEEDPAYAVHMVLSN